MKEYVVVVSQDVRLRVSAEDERAAILEAGPAAAELARQQADLGYDVERLQIRVARPKRVR